MRGSIAKWIPLLAAAAFLCLAPRAAAQSREDELIKAWEQLQKSDPATLTFEKIEARRYKLKTSLFPFDGEVKILNVFVDDRLAEFEEGAVTGTVECELVGINDEFRRKFFRSMAAWEGNNTLFWDKDAKKWISSREYYVRARARASELQCSVGTVASSMPSIILLAALAVALLLVFWAAARSRKQIKTVHDQTERTLKLAEDNNRLFREILAELKQINQKVQS